MRIVFVVLGVLLLAVPGCEIDAEIKDARECVPHCEDPGPTAAKQKDTYCCEKCELKDGWTKCTNCQKVRDKLATCESNRPWTVDNCTTIVILGEGEELYCK